MRNLLIRTWATACIATFFGFSAASASAQKAGSRETREYVQAAANSDQFEILEAEAALGQSANPEIRAFATRMLQDHQRLGQAVRDAAVRSGLKPPEVAVDADQAQWLGALQAATGSDFDRLYVRQQVVAHRSALTAQERYAKSGEVSNLRQVAASAIPLISSHADMAHELEVKLGSP